MHIHLHIMTELQIKVHEEGTFFRDTYNASRIDTLTPLMSPIRLLLCIILYTITLLLSLVI